MAHEVLGGEDAAWLHMDEATNPMVVNGVVELAAPLPLERAYPLLEHLASFPHFRARVVEPTLHAGRPSWEPDPSFQLSEHVEHVELESGDDATLQAFIGTTISGVLDKRHALWRAYLIDRPGAGTTILYRVHHSLADGFALLGVLLSLCDDASAVSEESKRGAPPRAQSGAFLGSAKALWRLVALPPDPKTILRGALGLEKRVAWSQPLALADIKGAAHLAGGTVNDLLVAIVTGALGRYLARRGERTPDLELHAMVPVNLRPASSPATLGNHFGLVVLGLPIGITDPIARLVAVKQRMDLLKASPEALVTHALLGTMGWAPRVLEDAGVAFFGKKASLVLTNVPGPRTRLTLAGVAVSRLMFWVPQSGRVGLGMSIFSYAGEVTIGIVADAALVPDPDALVADLHAEAASSIEAIRFRRA